MGGDFLVRLSNFLDNINEWTGRIFSWLVVPLTIVIIIEFITRSLNVPRIWTFESISFIFGAHFMLVAGYGLLYGSHVRIDLFTSRLSQKAQAFISIICYITVVFSVHACLALLRLGLFLFIVVNFRKIGEFLGANFISC